MWVLVPKRRVSRQDIKHRTLKEQGSEWCHSSHPQEAGLASESSACESGLLKMIRTSAHLLKVKRKNSATEEDFKNLKHTLPIENPLLWSPLHYKLNQSSYFPKGGLRWKMMNRPQTFFTYSTKKFGQNESKRMTRNTA